MKPLCALMLCLASLPPALAQQAPAPAPSPLPIKQITIFTSGVSYTERSGDVQDDATVDLTFPTAQVNDILKSLVQIDEKGQVRPAIYGTRDPLGRTLGTFAIDVSGNLTQADLYTRMRGARITAEGGEAGALTGRIVGVEQRQVAGADGKPISAPLMTILTDAGLSTIRLDTVKSVRLLDERLNKEFGEALALLAKGSDENRRQVSLHFAGNGKRGVRVGYVTEAPLWKMSYRLVVDAKGKPYLQGWALVENTSDEDWENVKLSLVSGRPVSFIQDLYQPLYIPRPVVGADVVASPFPQTHASSLAAGVELEPARMAAMGGQAARRRADMAGNAYGQGGMGGGGMQGEKGDRGVMGPPAAALPMEAGRENFALADALAKGGSVQADASGQAAGELFEYRIDTPVTLKRQQAAMIPVVAKEVDGVKVSVYNADWGSRYPLNAVRLHNDTGLYLRGGPITLFDGGTYAGDAKMEDVPKGESRLISYAVDLAIEAERKQAPVLVKEYTIQIKRGVLTLTSRLTQKTIYTLKSKADKPRNVLVEHPYDPNAKLVTPEKFDGRTPQVYRFPVTVPAGKSETLTVVTETPQPTIVEVLNSDVTFFAHLSTEKGLSAKLRESLEEIVKRRKVIDDATSQAAAKENEIKAMGDDQDRIRKNMAALDRESTLYKRYVATLDEQETKLQTLRKDAAKLRADAEAATRSLKTYMDGVTVEGTIVVPPAAQEGEAAAAAEK